MSEWSQANPTAISTGSPDLDSILQILTSTGMFVGGMIGFILDNTVAGHTGLNISVINTRDIVRSFIFNLI